MAAFQATERELEELYSLLLKAGAGQWVRNSYAAVTGVTNPVVVYAYLREKAGKELTKNFALMLANACVEYILQGYDVQILLKALKVQEKVTLRIPT